MVCRKIRVAVLATGNEVVDFDRELKPGQIRNSNAIALEAMLKEDGHEATLLGTARDHPDDLAQKITKGLEADALITSGGVSVGDHDFIMEAFSILKIELKFWKINMRPGMPMAFGLAQNSKPIFALPGNPVSTLVTYSQFVRSGLLKMAGFEEADRTLRLQATLVEDMKKVDGKRHFVRGVCSSAGNRLEVRSTGSQSSAVLTSLVRANCLIILPEEKRNPAAGESVEIELL
jgi:molybdopterin molybdotransferase